MVRRLLGAFLLFSTHRDGGVAIRIQSANAFAPPALRKDVAKNVGLPNLHRQQQVVIDTQIEMADAPSSSDNESLTSTSKYLPITALATLSLVSIAAFTHHLPGPIIDSTSPPAFWSTLPYGVIYSGSYALYTPTLIIRDIFSTLLSIVGAGVFVKGITGRAKDGLLQPRDSRKIIHTFSAPLFILLWPVFSKAYGARVFASIVPLLNALRLFMAGKSSSSSGNGEESELASAISRSGDAKEALGGPFIYVMVLLISTLFFWTDTPIGIVSVATMSVGDGLADLVGRRYGQTNKWSFNKDKSMTGSAAFVAGSFVASFSLISWLIHMGSMDALSLSPISLCIRLLAIAIICAGVELIPIGDDNWSVPFSAAVLSALLLNRINA